MSTNPDINMAQGFVTSEPTGDGIKLYANDVDITDEIGGSGGGGDGGIFVVKFSVDAQTEQATCENSYAEIQSAFSSGKHLVGEFAIPSMVTIGGEILSFDGAFGGQFALVQPAGGGGMLLIYQVLIDSTDTVSTRVYYAELIGPG